MAPLEMVRSAEWRASLVKGSRGVFAARSRGVRHAGGSAAHLELTRPESVVEGVAHQFGHDRFRTGDALGVLAVRCPVNE